MRKFLFLLLLASPIVASAQLTTINPDTVCYQTNGSIYAVTNVPGNTYTWTVSAPGILVSGQGSSSIEVNWSAAAPGTIANGITVFATNAAGCVSPPISINIFILNIVPTVAPLTFCVGEPCATLAGTPLGGTWTGPGVIGNTFCPSAALIGNNTVTYSITLGGCTFTAAGTMTVNPLITISPISHN